MNFKKKILLISLLIITILFLFSKYINGIIEGYSSNTPQISGNCKEITLSDKNGDPYRMLNAKCQVSGNVYLKTSIDRNTCSQDRYKNSSPGGKLKCN